MENKKKSEDVFEELLFQNPFEKGFIKTTSMVFNSHNVYLDGEIGEVSKYRDLFYLLETASENDEIVFHLNTPGGNLNTTCQIINGLKVTQATTKAVIHQEAASAGSLLALSVEELYLTPFSSMLCHAGSYGYGGFTGRMDNAVTHINASIRAIMEELYEGFLNPEELKQLDIGQEFWFNTLQIEERLKMRDTYFQLKHEKEQLAKEKAALAPKKKAPKTK